ncbi:MAG: type II toxin-antitoxin system VapC family toxin [candidate division NC10 bacterium]
MTGLDTNVLVRYLTQDDPAQFRRAAALIEEVVARGERCAIGVIVCCELVWVLRDKYGADRATVAGVLEAMLRTAHLVVEDKDLVRRALEDYRRGPGDFADYLMGWRNRRAGCEHTATFDRALKDSSLFALL